MDDIKRNINNEVMQIVNSKNLNIKEFQVYRIVDFAFTYSIESERQEANNNNELVVLKRTNYDKNEQKSIKNLVLNFKKLMYQLSLSTFTVVTTLDHLWLIPFAFIVLCNEILKSISLPINQLSGQVLLCIWEFEFQNKEAITQKKLYRELGKIGYDIKNKELVLELRKLESLGIIKIDKEIKLNEKIILC